MASRRELITGIAIGASAIIVLGIVAFFLFFLSASRPSAPLPGTSLPNTEKELAKREAPATGEKNQESNITERLVIKTKTITLVVKNIRSAYQEIEGIVHQYQGFITNSNLSAEEGEVIVKVPAKKFSQAEKNLKKLGKVKSEEEGEEDVTQKYIDLKSRLRNFQREEARYLDFFDAAKTVEEMLKIETELSRVRGEIESLQGQIDYLETSAAMATITIELFKPSKVVSPTGYDWGFIKAITQAIRNFVLVINAIIMAIGVLLPLALLGGITWLVIVRIRRQPSK